MLVFFFGGGVRGILLRLNLGRQDPKSSQMHGNQPKKHSPHPESQLSEEVLATKNPKVLYVSRVKNSEKVTFEGPEKSVRKPVFNSEVSQIFG